MYLRSASKAIDFAHRALAGPDHARAAPWRGLGGRGPGGARGHRPARRGPARHRRDPCAGPRAGRGRDRRDDLGPASVHRRAARRPDERPGGRLRRDRARPRPEFVVLAVSAAVLAGLERDETPDSLRRLIDRTGIRYDTEFSPSSQLRYASGVLRAAAGNHEAAVEELRSCELDHPALGGENPAVLAWRSAASLSLAELGRFEEARALAADEVRRAQSFGAPRAIGIRRAHRSFRGARNEPRGSARGAGILTGTSRARASAR